MAEPGALRRALDQPGDVGEDDLAVIAVDRPQHRRQRRERVVGNLRRRPGQPRQQRGLAGVRQPDQPDVGQQLQPQLDPVRLPVVPLSANRGACRVELANRLLPCPPRPPCGDHRPLSRLDQIDALPVQVVACVPGGTGMTRSSPRAPCLFALPMPPALPAKVPAAFSPEIPPRGSQTSTTSPPCPPSPPSGPPRGTCASRRKQTQPSPPAPPRRRSSPCRT